MIQLLANADTEEEEDSVVMILLCCKRKGMGVGTRGRREGESLVLY